MPEINHPELNSDFSRSNSSSAGQKEETIPRVDPHQLNFHSPEFNAIDDLDDNTGNYTTFHSLDGIVTADMRFHAERKRAEKAAEKVSADAGQVGETREKTPSQREDIDPHATVTLVSHGRTLLIGADPERALECGKSLADQGLACTICVQSPGSSLALSRIGSQVLIKTDSLFIDGSFGGFTATAADRGGKTNLALMTGEEAGYFDLVLDLQATPSYRGRQLPIGYFAPGGNETLLDEALSELPRMRGRFTKPQFTFFREKQCIHGRSRGQNCQRCLDICPVDAIKSKGKGVDIDSYMCQGCAGCSLVCPADAIRMRSRESLLKELHAILCDRTLYRKHPQDLVLYDRNIGSDEFHREKERCIFVGVDEIASIGVDVLLASMAYGVHRVTLVSDRDRPAEIRQALAQHVELGREILQGLGIAGERLRYHVSSSEQTSEIDSDTDCGTTAVAGPIVSPAAFEPEQDKRTLTRLAVQHLREASGRKPVFIPLSEGAPFGTVVIDPAACSFCMSCVGACPSKALASGGTVPRIAFMEADCHQCGLCASVCPENAIRLQPRFLCDGDSATTESLLLEEEPFSCIECGDRFASWSMINRMEEKLSGHWMYSSDRQKRRLQMCRTCRTRDALTAGDYR